MLLLILPLLALMMVGVYYSPLYKAKAEQYEEARNHARLYISGAYYNLSLFEKKELMKHYELTESDVVPLNIKIMQQNKQGSGG